MQFLNRPATIFPSWLALSLASAGAGRLVRRAAGGKDATLGGIAGAFWIGWGTLIVLLQVWHLFLPINGWALALAAVLGSWG